MYTFLWVLTCDGDRSYLLRWYATGGQTEHARHTGCLQLAHNARHVDFGMVGVLEWSNTVDHAYGLHAGLLRKEVRYVLSQTRRERCCCICSCSCHLCLRIRGLVLVDRE